MSDINKLFINPFPQPLPPTHIQNKDFNFNLNLNSSYLTLNILSYAYLKETGYRVLAGLSYGSYSYLRQ